jgi:hypothetical protein
LALREGEGKTLCPELQAWVDQWVGAEKRPYVPKPRETRPRPSKEQLQPQEHRFNKRTKNFIDGVPLTEVARQHNMNPNVLYFRIKNGWSVQEALERPVREWKR